MEDSERDEIHATTNPISSTDKKIYNAKRSVVLRRLKRIDLKACMESFSKYTSLSASLFRTSLSCITIVDETMVWVLASHGSRRKPIYFIERQGTYCEYLMNPSVSDILIVDEIHKPCIVGGLTETEVTSNHSENYQFYASVALEIEGARIGTFVLYDIKPRPDFKDLYQKSFRDLSLCVADVLLSQINLSDQLLLGWTGLMVGVTHNLRTPLSVASLSISEAFNQISRLQNKSGDAINSVDVTEALENCHNAEIASQQLQLVIDANSNLGK